MLIQQWTNNQLQNNPLMAQFKQMMSGKNGAEQTQTLLNLAKSRGLDVNAKCFTEADLKALGLR